MLCEKLESLAAMTLRHCAQCAVPYSCCTPHGCSLAAAYMGESAPAGAPGANLRFMGDNGCTLRPEQRPHCAKWSCKFLDPRWKHENKDEYTQYVNDAHAVNAHLAFHARQRAAESQ